MCTRPVRFLVLLTLAAMTPFLGADDTAGAAVHRLERLFDSGSIPWSGKGEASPVSTLLPLADGRIAAAFLPENEFSVWDDFPDLQLIDPESGTAVTLSQGEGIRTAALDRSSGMIAALGTDTLSLYSVSGTVSGENEDGTGTTENIPACLAFTGDSMLALGGRDARIRLYENGLTYGGSPLIGHAGTVTALTAVGNRLLSAGTDGSIKEWDTASRTHLKTFRPGTAPAVALGRGPGSDRAAAMLADGTLVILDTAALSQSRSLKTGLAGVSLCAFTPDGKAAAAADGAGTVIVLDLTRLTEVLKVEAPAEGSPPVTSLALSDDGLVLYRGLSDGSIAMSPVDPFVLSALEAAGVPEKTRLSRLAGLKLGSGNPLPAAALFEKAADKAGMALCARTLLTAGSLTEAETYFRKAGDGSGLSDTGGAYCKAGDWEAAFRCFSEVSGQKTAACTVGDACLAASDFKAGLTYYLQSGDAARLKKLAQLFFIRKEYDRSAQAYSKAGDRDGTKKAAEELYASGSRGEAASILLGIGDKTTPASWAGKLMESGKWNEAGEIYALLKDKAGMKKAASALLEAAARDDGLYDEAFALFIAAGDTPSARKIPDQFVAEAQSAVKKASSMTELITVLSTRGALYEKAASLYEEGGMLADVTASLAAQVQKGDYILALYIYSRQQNTAKLTQVGDTALKAGNLIMAMTAYLIARDNAKIVKTAQSFMKAKKYEDAAMGYRTAGDKEGMEAAATALLAAGKTDLAESLYRETGSPAGLSAIGDAASKTGNHMKAARFYGMAGNAQKFLSSVKEAEKTSGPSAVAGLYYDFADNATLASAAKRFLESGYLEEAGDLYMKANDNEGMRAVAEKYLESGLTEAAADIYRSLGDEGAARTVETVSTRTAAELRDDAEDAEENGMPLQAAELYFEAGDSDETIRLAREIIEEHSVWDAGRVLSLCERIGDAGLTKQAVRAQLEDGTYRYYAPGETRETAFAAAVSALGTAGTADAARMLLDEGSYAFPLFVYAKNNDTAGLTRCAEVMLENGDAEGAAAVYARTGDRQGLSRTAAKYLGYTGNRPDSFQIARTLYGLAGDTSGLSSCGSAWLDWAVETRDIRGAALCFLDAGDAAGMAVTADRYARDGKYALASHWAKLSGDETRAKTFAAMAGPSPALKVALHAQRTAGEVWMDEEPFPWKSFLEPVIGDRNGNPLEDRMREDLENGGFIVIGDKEGRPDYTLTVEAHDYGWNAPGKGEFSFTLSDTAGRKLISLLEKDVPLEDHAVVEDIGIIVRQRLEE